MNRLGATVLPNGQIHTSTYRFDHLRYSHVSPTEGTEQFIWDHQKPDGLRDMLVRIGTGGGTTHLEVHGENLARYMGLRGDGAPLNWMLQEDAQQSVQSNVGIYGGVPASDGRFKTDAFGNNYAADLPGQPYEFGGGLGYWYDPDLALHYVRERWYDAKSGTWLSVDPVSSEPRYSYVHQMPTTHVDPSGTQFAQSFINGPVPNFDATDSGKQTDVSKIIRDALKPKSDFQNYFPSDDSLGAEFRRGMGELSSALGDTTRSIFRSVIDLVEMDKRNWEASARNATAQWAPVAREIADLFLRKCGGQKWFQQLNNLFRDWRRNWHPIFKNLTPPDLSFSGQYLEGFVGGVISGVTTLIMGFDPLMWIDQLASVAKFIVSTPGLDLFQKVLYQLELTIRPFLTEQDCKRLPIKMRGEIVGCLISTAMGMILLEFLARIPKVPAAAREFHGNPSGRPSSGGISARKPEIPPEISNAKYSETDTQSFANNVVDQKIDLQDVVRRVNPIREVDVQISKPSILRDPTLTEPERQYLVERLRRKIAALNRFAKDGRLKWTPKTDDVRLSDLQAKYRKEIADRFERRFERLLDVSRLDVDHPHDLIYGGSAKQKLRMLDESINRSIGISLRRAGERLRLNEGDIIRSVNLRD